MMGTIRMKSHAGQQGADFVLVFFGLSWDSWDSWGSLVFDSYPYVLRIGPIDTNYLQLWLLISRLGGSGGGMGRSEGGCGGLSVCRSVVLSFCRYATDVRWSCRAYQGGREWSSRGW